MRNNKNIAIKRITKDIKEITECPLIGIGIAQYNNSFFDYIVNIQLMDGIYKGLCLQLKMKFPDTYPIEPPEMKLIPGQIDHTYHHHIYGTEFCLDIFKNRYLPINDYGTGYNSSYTISSLLLQMQVFLSDPDFPPMDNKPSKDQIKKLFENMNTFRMEYTNEKGEQVTHTWKHPYPEMYFPARTIKKEDDEDSPIKKIVYNESQEIKENLTCSVLKVDYLSDDTTAFGYPVYTEEHGNRYCPIPEMVSYEAFINHIQNNSYKLENYFDVKYKSSSGQYYNCWFPIYINEKHYVNNEEHIKNALTVIKHGCSGIEKYDFKPRYIVEVFPKLLNSMIEGMITKKSILSESFIKCYYHFILLFQKMCQKYKGNINQIPIVKNALDRLIRNKKALYFEDDILLLLFTDNEKTQAVKLLVTNYFRENIKCELQKKETKDFLVETLLNQLASASVCKSNSSQRIQFFQDFDKLNKWGDIFEIVNKNKELIKDFEKTKTKEPDLSVLPKDSDVEYVEEDIDGEEKDFFADEEEQKPKCPIETYNEYVSFYDYIKNNILYGDSNVIFSKLSIEERQKLLDYIQDKFDLTKKKEYLNEKDITESQLFEKKEIVDLLDLCNETSKRKFVEYIYSNNNKNKLLSIIYLAKKKFSDQQFMKELEEHYGVLLQWELYKAIDETKEAITNIKSFSYFCQRIGHPEYINNDIQFIKNSLVV